MRYQYGYTVTKEDESQKNTLGTVDEDGKAAKEKEIASYNFVYQGGGGSESDLHTAWFIEPVEEEAVMIGKADSALIGKEAIFSDGIDTIEFVVMKISDDEKWYLDGVGGLFPYYNVTPKQKTAKQIEAENDYICDWLELRNKQEDERCHTA